MLAALGDTVSELDRTLDTRAVTKAVTPPRKDKWRTENPAEIESILPTIGPLMRRLGYAIEDAAPSA